MNKKIITFLLSLSIAFQLNAMEKLGDGKINLLNFPDELLLEIINKLPPQDFGRVARTCNHFHRIAAEPCLYLNRKRKAELEIQKELEQANLQYNAITNTITGTQKRLGSLEWIEDLDYLSYIIKLILHFQSQFGQDFCQQKLDAIVKYLNNIYTAQVTSENIRIFAENAIDQDAKDALKYLWSLICIFYPGYEEYFIREFLDYAIINCSTKCAQFIICLNLLDINTPDHRGWTFLDYAIKYYYVKNKAPGNRDIILLLLQNGAIEKSFTIPEEIEQTSHKRNATSELDHGSKKAGTEE